MAKIIDFPTFNDERGFLTVVEKVFVGDIKRIYYIYGVDNQVRGGHRHKKTMQVLIALNGSCDIYTESSIHTQTFLLDSPARGLVLEPEDWHTMQNFSSDCILLVLASEYYDKDDYIDERY